MSKTEVRALGVLTRGGKKILTTVYTEVDVGPIGSDGSCMVRVGEIRFAIPRGDPNSGKMVGIGRIPKGWTVERTDLVDTVQVAILQAMEDARAGGKP